MQLGKRILPRSKFSRIYICIYAHITLARSRDCTFLYEHASSRDREAESAGARRDPGAGREHSACGVDLVPVDVAIEVCGVAHTISSCWCRARRLLVGKAADEELGGEAEQTKLALMV